MTELNPEITKEIDHIFLSLEKSKTEIEKQFKSLLEDFTQEAWNNFDYYIESDARYNFDRWIRQTCNEIIEGLLSGDTRWLKQQAIISEYSWEKIQKIRLAIWNAAHEGITESMIHVHEKEVIELKNRIKRLEDENLRLRTQYIPR